MTTNTTFTTTTTPSADPQVRRNVRIHDRLARKYEKIHGEIFNDIEQERVKAILQRACDLAQAVHRPFRALDFGCGSGNLTRHMLDLGLQVTAADVSQGFLDLVGSRYPQARTLLLENGSLSRLPSGAFDLIATYSVLHHIPDYLAACGELARACAPGGVVMIDHEPAESFWEADPTYAAFQRQATRFDWQKFLRPANYLHRVRRVFDPRHSNEGDIHVWPDDHVEWPKLKTLMIEKGFNPVVEESYLLHRKLYRPEIYRQYVGRLVDTKVMIFRKDR